MKKKKNWFLRLLLILFIVFIGLYIASISGYYEATLGNKVALTDEAIKRFEQDVIEGKMVDVENYILEERVDYSNTFTDAADKITELTQKVLSEGISGIWDAIKVLFF